MKKIVYNSTEGGSHIKGTKRISLKNYIKEYCQEPINKDKITPLLSYADNADELIEKVIPLLKDDINNINDVIKNSRKGMAISKGIKKLISQPKWNRLLTKKKEEIFNQLNQEAIKEAPGSPLIINQIFFQKIINRLGKSKLKTLIKMSSNNFTFSEAAHIACKKNPLINVAVYGASRQIQTRNLKVDASINHFLKNKKDAITRTERNIIILKAAKTAAESLKKSYKKTLKLLEKYNKTKDDSLLTSNEIEEINLDDAEDYFEKGNWAHPLLDAQKILDRKEEFKTTTNKKGEIIWNKDSQLRMDELKKAQKIYNKAIKMRTEAIEKAKADEEENHDKMVKLVKYNELMEQAKDTGRKEKDFKTALELMREAIKLMPEEQEARWGLASALHHTENFKESIQEYKKLIKDFPDNYTFQFELGQTLLINNQMQEGLKEIGKVMEKTNQFDNFLCRVGEIYKESNMLKEALIAYSSYLDKFPADFKVWIKKGECLTKMNRHKLAEKAFNKAKQINPRIKNENIL